MLGVPRIGHNQSAYRRIIAQDTAELLSTLPTFPVLFSLTDHHADSIAGHRFHDGWHPRWCVSLRTAGCVVCFLSWVACRLLFEYYPISRSPRVKRKSGKGRVCRVSLVIRTTLCDFISLQYGEDMVQMGIRLDRQDLNNQRNFLCSKSSYEFEHTSTATYCHGKAITRSERCYKCN
jgi:hypothetical protein